ncbi:hypothetical protein [Planctobacterium marinum]|uniref:DUF2383 domain-containing protein n=1 Tax=Planctobacterium marinum TaxID=1631968 RepID=A0AA48HKT2_9ALTE|nr:hypothetical protein MACH26_25800 [Planctobacterium marinum]
MNESISNKAEYIFVQRLQEVCKHLSSFYSNAAAHASTYMLRTHMQAFNSVMREAVESLLPFQSNRLKLSEQNNDALCKVESAYKEQQSQLSQLPTTAWVMDSNKRLREFLALLRKLTQAQEDKLLRYVLSDITAQLQLKHDQLLEKLNRQQDRFPASVN